MYRVPPRQNPAYQYRETLELGTTPLSRAEVQQALLRMQREWPGAGYDMCRRNCCHACYELCSLLRVQQPPAWLNRFANGADFTLAVSSRVASWVRGGCATSAWARSSASPC